MSRRDQKFILAEYQYVPVDTCIVKLSRRIPLSANCLLFCRYKVIARERFKWYDVYRCKYNIFFFLSLLFIRSLFISDWPNSLDLQLDGGGICYCHFFDSSRCREQEGGWGWQLQLTLLEQYPVLIQLARKKQTNKQRKTLPNSTLRTLSKRNPKVPKFNLFDQHPKTPQTNLHRVDTPVFIYFLFLDRWALSCLPCRPCACLGPLAIIRRTAVFFN